METLNANNVTSNDAGKKIKETTLKEGEKEVEKAQDKNDSKSGVGNTSLVKTEAKSESKIATEDLRTKPEKAKAPVSESKHEEVKGAKHTKVDLPRIRIRTYLKPRVPSFRKQGNKEKGGKDCNVREILKKNRKPKTPKFQSRSKLTKRNARGLSPRRGAQKVRFIRKPPVPRFATSKRSKVDLKKKRNFVNAFSSGENMAKYHRRFKRKPALPDFAAIRKQKRMQISKGKWKKFKSEIVPGMNLGKTKDLSKSMDGGNFTISKATQIVVPNEKKPEKGATSNQVFKTKIVHTEQKKANSATSGTTKTVGKSVSSKKSNQSGVGSSPKLCAEPVNIGIRKSVIRKQRLQCPKVRLDRGKNTGMTTKDILPNNCIGKIKDTIMSAKKMKTVGKTKGNETSRVRGKGTKDKAGKTARLNAIQKQSRKGDKSSKAVGKVTIGEADKIEGVNSGQKQPLAGGGRLEKDRESGKLFASV